MFEKSLRPSGAKIAFCARDAKTPNFEGPPRKIFPLLRVGIFFGSSWDLIEQLPTEICFGKILPLLPKIKLRLTVLYHDSYGKSFDNLTMGVIGNGQHG